MAVRIFTKFTLENYFTNLAAVKRLSPVQISIFWQYVASEHPRMYFKLRAFATPPSNIVTTQTAGMSDALYVEYLTIVEQWLKINNPFPEQQ